jgi:outer membrane protein assembly factor BamB
MDTWNNRVQVLDPKKGKVLKVLTSTDGFFGPREVVVDKAGFVYVADTGRHRVVKFAPTGDRVRVLGSAKGKGNQEGEFNEPIGLALDGAGNLYVADRLNFRIQVFDANGQFVRKFAVKGGKPTRSTWNPTWPSTRSGVVFIARMVAASGSFASTSTGTNCLVGKGRERSEPFPRSFGRRGGPAGCLVRDRRRSSEGDEAESRMTFGGRDDGQ